MGSNPRFNYLVILKDHGADKDITKHVQDLEYRETGNEEISSARMKLNAHFGRFIVDATVIGGVTFDKINFFDRLFIRFTDDDGTELEDVMEVRIIKPKEVDGQGDVLELELDNQGWHFNNIHNLKQYERQSGFEIFKDLCDFYTNPDTIGTAQPTLEGQDQVFSFGVDYKSSFGIALSQATNNIFDFSNAEIYCGDAANEVVEWMGAPVSVGGELEFFDWRMIPKYNHSTGADLDIMRIMCRVSGDIPGAKVVISKTDASPIVKVTETKGTLHHESGTSTYSWADPNAGSLPTIFSIYFGDKEFHFSAKEWFDTRIYKTGMRVKHIGAIYEALLNHTANDGVNDPITGIGVFWVLKTFAVGDGYSFWTKLKPQYWINAGAGYIDSTTFPATGRACQHDQNLVIRDGGHKRTYVDLQANDLQVASIPADMILEGGSRVMYRTFRIRINGTPTVAQVFAQNSGVDRTGKTYTDAIVQHNGATNTGANEFLNWDVFEPAVDDLECTDLRTGRCFTFNPAVVGIFQSTAIGGRQVGWIEGGYTPDFIPLQGFGALFVANLIFDCLHDYDIIDATPDIPDFGSAEGMEGAILGANSAVRVKYTLIPGSRKVGFWLNWAFPAPISGFAGAFTLETVGEEYKPPTLDFNNMHLSAREVRGLNQGLDARNRGAEDFGKINALRFYLKVIGLNAGGFDILQGNIKVGVVFYDSSDNVIMSKDAVVNVLKNYEEITVPIDSLKIYRARSEFPFLPVQELEILDIFANRNVKRMAIFSLDSYDKEGRYLSINRFNVELFSTLEADIDGFHFVKPLATTTQESIVQGSKPSRNLEPRPKTYAYISNYRQLKNASRSFLEIVRFKYVKYQITRGMKLNVRFGEEFTYKHPNLVDDPDVAPNDEVDLICKENVITINKGKGRGGFMVVTHGVKRIRV